MSSTKKTGYVPPLESPIPFWTGSNGEFMPRGRGPRAIACEEMFRRLVDERARRMGVTRRAFIDSMAGTATALFVIQTVGGCQGQLDGGYPIDAEMTWDSARACERLRGNEFIFDVQTHHVNPNGSWQDSNPLPALILQSLPQAMCGEAVPLDCYGTEHYIRELFINSDTDVAVLSAFPANPGQSPLTIEEQNETQSLVNRLAGSRRLIVHGLVLPDQGPTQIEAMAALAYEKHVAAWKIYTPFGGWRLTDPAGLQFLDEARRLRVNIVCAHKGLSLPGFDPAFASPADIAVIAPYYPDLKFVVYHSGWESDVPEGPYDPEGKGVDRLIRACADAGIGPRGNVYAELGSLWRGVMADPVQSQHVVGKLLAHFGPDRVLWGTDSIWYGSPQDQIAAFRALQISAELQEQFGYPALTPKVKAKIFGLNAAALYCIDPRERRCAITDSDLGKLRVQARQEGLDGASYRGYGPRTRRAFMNLLRSREGRPA